MTLRRSLALALIVAVASPLAGCAYYNTFYLARRNYDRSLQRVPYALDRTDVTPGAQLPKAIDYAKKVITGYPKSKWVDDADLLWAKALIANDDPRQAVRMLEEFPTQFPKSSLRDEARFYLGVAYRQSRKYERALAMLDTFLIEAPKHDLAPYAQYERARALISLDRPAEAAEAAGRVLDKNSKGDLAVRARIARADALFGQKAYERARQDYHALGTQATDDDVRLGYLLRETECMELGGQYAEALRMLNDAISHERAPVMSDTTGGRPAVVQATPGYDRYGRLKVRMGTVMMRSGRTPDALDAYRDVVRAYPRTPISAEAQFRMGYAMEVATDDFESARAEYARVRDQSPGSPFADQAQQRLASLDRLAQFRKAGGDSADMRAEAEFLLAEQYLFQLDQPDRAVDQYQKIERAYPDSPHAAKAIAARGWVLSRKLKRRAEADSLFWIVVRQHPGTEAQLAARDYLELDGVSVPTSLIKLPIKPPPPPPDTTHALTPPPPGTTALGVRSPRADSLRLSGGRGRFGADSLEESPPPPPPSTLSRRDSLLQRMTRRGAGAGDTLGTVPTPRDTASVHSAVPDPARGHPPAPAPTDTTRGRSLPPDSTRRGAPGDTTAAPPPGGSGGRRGSA